MIWTLASCVRSGYSHTSSEESDERSKHADAAVLEATVIDTLGLDVNIRDSAVVDSFVEDSAQVDVVNVDTALDDVVTIDDANTIADTSEVADNTSAPDSTLSTTPFAVTSNWNVGSVGNDNAQAVAFDSQSSLLVIGRYSGSIDFDEGSGVAQCTSNGLMDIFVTKRSAAGQHLWTRCFGGPEDDWGLAIAVDAADNVLVSGRFQGTDVDFDSGPAQDLHSSPSAMNVFLTLLRSDGSYGWTLTFGSPDSGCLGREIVVAQDGSVLISGDFGGTDVDLDPTSGTSLHTSNGWGDYYVIKLNPDYSFAWSRSAGGTLGEGGRGLAVDDENNVYVAGYFYLTSDLDPTSGVQQRTSNGSHDVFVVKLSATGLLRWIHTFGGPAADNGFDLGVDHLGHVYVTGAFSGAGTDLDPTATFDLRSSAGAYDGYIIKLSSDGLFQWARTFGGGLADTVEGIAMYQSEHFAVTGSFSDLGVDFDPGSGELLTDSRGETDAYVMLFDLNGEITWRQTFGSDGPDYGRSIAVSPLGDIAFVGAFSGTNMHFDPDNQSLIEATRGDYDAFAVTLSPP
jgi:hypothetical protein